MSIGPVRPRFVRKLPGEVPAVIARVMAACGAPGAGCVPRELGHHIDLSIPPGQRRLWSPSVHMEFSAGDGPSTTMVHGQIGPQPGTWTFFFFAFVHAGVIAFFGACVWLIQLWLDMPAWGVWVTTGGVALALSIYAASQIGRRLAAEQTAALMSIVDAAMSEFGPSGGEEGPTERDES